MISVFAISAPVQQITSESDAADGNVLLKAEYTAMALVGEWSEAVLMVVPEIERRFKDYTKEGRVTIKTISSDKLLEMQFGYENYSPLGVNEIPLMVVKEADYDSSLDALEKYFRVPASAIVSTSYQ